MHVRSVVWLVPGALEHVSNYSWSSYLTIGQQQLSKNSFKYLVVYCIDCQRVYCIDCFFVSVARVRRSLTVSLFWYIFFTHNTHFNSGPFLVSVQQFRQQVLSTFSCAWCRLHVCVWQLLQVYPRFARVACFPSLSTCFQICRALGTGYMFPRACYWLLMFARFFW